MYSGAGEFGVQAPPKQQGGGGERGTEEWRGETLPGRRHLWSLQAVLAHCLLSPVPPSPGLQAVLHIEQGALARAVVQRLVADALALKVQMEADAEAAAAAAEAAEAARLAKVRRRVLIWWGRQYLVLGAD